MRPKTGVEPCAVWTLHRTTTDTLAHTFRTTLLQPSVIDDVPFLLQPHLLFPQQPVRDKFLQDLSNRPVISNTSHAAMSQHPHLQGSQLDVEVLRQADDQAQGAVHRCVEQRRGQGRKLGVGQAHDEGPWAQAVDHAAQVVLADDLSRITEGRVCKGL